MVETTEELLVCRMSFMDKKRDKVERNRRQVPSFIDIPPDPAFNFLSWNYVQHNVLIAVKINKWDGAAAKNAIDDAIREVFTGDLKCKESFALIDGRLFLCALAVGVALYALLWDYLYPFPESRLVLIICVSSYFILMSILTLYTTFKEKGIFVVAREKVGNNTKVWEASSYVKKHDDKYNLVLVMRDSNGKYRESSINKSFANFIDSNGTIAQNTVTNEMTKLYNSLSSEKKEK